MSYFQIGTGFKQPDWCTAIIKCGSDEGVECTEFIDSGAGVTVCHLYNVADCDYISESDLVVEIRSKGSTTWSSFVTYTMGGYDGFTYHLIKFNNSINFEFKATYKGITKYYSIVEPCVPNWQCRQPLDGYETDVNDCGEADRYDSECEDQCEGVVCDNICDGLDLWSQKCDSATGLCINDQLLESNSSFCDIDLCEDVVCGNICVDNDLWSQSCDTDTGMCELDQLLQPNSATCIVTEYIPTDNSTIQTYLVLGGIGLAGLAILMLSKKR